MCLALIALDAHPDYAIVIVANRDEFHARPASPAGWWAEGWLGGRDLEGGGTVKGNLIGIDADPAKIKFGMPVRVVYKDALGRKDREGNSYTSYFFEPR